MACSVDSRGAGSSNSSYIVAGPTINPEAIKIKTPLRPIEHPAAMDELLEAVAQTKALAVQGVLSLWASGLWFFALFGAG